MSSCFHPLKFSRSGVLLPILLLISTLLTSVFPAAGPARADEIDDWSLSVLPGLPPGDETGAPKELAHLVDIGGRKVYLIHIPPERAEYITGLYKVLWGFQANGAIRNGMNDYGAFIRTRCAVRNCTPIPHKRDRLASYNQSWKAFALLTSAFHLKRRQAFGVAVKDGEARIIDGVRTSSVTRLKEVTFDWDADWQILAVVVTDFIDSDETGPMMERGEYAVNARSVQTAISRSKSVSTTFQEDKIGIHADSRVVNNKKRLRILIDGNTYVLQTGHFSAIEREFSDGSSTIEFSFGADWLTDMDVSYEEFAIVDETGCESKERIGIDFSLKDGARGVNFTKSTEANCITNQSVLPVWVKWRAVPTEDLKFDELDGLRSRIRFVVERNPDGSAHSYYRPRFRAGIHWVCKAYASDGGKQSGGINISSPGVGDRYAGKKFYKRFF